MSKEAIIRRMDELLTPLGFTRQQATWNRKSGSVIDVIDLQTSKTGDRVTINAGVLNPEVYAKCWGNEPPQFVDEPSCTVRTRIGQLIEGKDIWWRLVDQGTVNDIAARLTAVVLPFLELMHSPEAMAQFLTSAQVIKQKYPPPIIYLAILKIELGDGTSARALLADLRKKTVSAWQNRIDEVMGRLGFL